jgi:hypothetical protein
MTDGFHTPILLLTFNRPDVTARVFQAIRAVRPTRLFIAGDGPRADRAGDQEAVLETQKVVESIDWDCQVVRNYQGTNLGCRLGVSSAISWFFEQVTEGIILEDDCLADSSFFQFCSVLLERYRDDNRVGMVAGTNYLGETSGQHSYFFSHHCPIWGWATWRRAWVKYDLNMAAWAEFKSEEYMSTVHRNEGIARFFSTIYDLMAENKIDTWDHQWSFTCTRENWLTIIPRRNLVSNIGFSDTATHTKDPANLLANRARFAINSETWSHPGIVLPNPAAEEQLSEFVLSIMGEKKEIKKRPSMLARVKRWIRG